MPLLAYCIIDAAAHLDFLISGLQAQPFQLITDSRVSAVVSKYEGKPDTNARTEALEFNRILQHFFRQVAIIPFRFPTILDSADEMARFLQEHGEHYQGLLTRLRDAVQMEINVTLDGLVASEPASGTEYLTQKQNRRHKLATTGKRFHEASANEIEDWRQREGANSLRCFALVARGKANEFLSQVQNVQLASGIHARVSGPWPPTEFFNEK